MRIFLTVLVLIISFQSVSKADDIRDFQIEGMSIGDSLLDHLSLNEINNNKGYLYKNKKYATSYKDFYDGPYEVVQFEFKNEDKSFRIKSLTGMIIYENKDFKECYEKESIIVNELKDLFATKTIYVDYGMSSHPADKSEKSKGTWHVFEFKDDSGYIFVECMDWSDQMDYDDALKVTILSKEMNTYLDNEAY